MSDGRAAPLCFHNSASPMARLFNIGDRVRSELYGDGSITHWQCDRNLGWVYSIRFDKSLTDTCDTWVYGTQDGGHVCSLVQSALIPVPVIDQLADLA